MASSPDLVQSTAAAVTASTTYPRQTLSPGSIASIAFQAGFRSSGLVSITAIALTESGGDTAARCFNTGHGCGGSNGNGNNTSVDRGILQINSKAWPQTNPTGNPYSVLPQGQDPCDNPAYSFQFAYQIITKGGTNFGAWADDLSSRSKQVGAATIAAQQATASNGGGAIVGATLLDDTGTGTTAGSTVLPITGDDVLVDSNEPPAIDSSNAAMVAAATIKPATIPDLSTMTVNGTVLSQLTADGNIPFISLVTKAQLDLSTNTASKLTVTFAQGDLLLRDGRLFPTVPLDNWITWMGQSFSISQNTLQADAAGRPELQVDAIASGIFRMMYDYNPPWPAGTSPTDPNDVDTTTDSPTSYIQSNMQRYIVNFEGEDTYQGAFNAGFPTPENLATGAPPETMWEFVQALAQQQGFWIYERQNCVRPETPILCSDFTWRPAGELRAGDEIVAFDEEPVPVRRVGKLNDKRHYRTATIERNEPGWKPCMTMTTDVGLPVTATLDHPWLVWREGLPARPDSKAIRKRAARKGFVWVTTEDLRAGDKIAWFGNPWTFDHSREAGWLAGMFDGEGHLSRSHRKDPADGDFWALGVSQRESETLDRLKRTLSDRGFEIGQSCARGLGKQPCWTLHINGGMREVARLLGTVAPERFTERDLTGMFDGTWIKKGVSVDLATVTSVEDVGIQAIASIQTSTRTMITGGYLSHNTIWFGKPTWLADRGQILNIDYRLATEQPTINSPVGVPQLTVGIQVIPGQWGSIGVVDSVRNWTFEVPQWLGAQVQPGDKIVLGGLADVVNSVTDPTVESAVGPNTAYIVTGVTWTIDSGLSNVQITAEQAVNPRPTYDTNVSTGSSDTSTQNAATTDAMYSSIDTSNIFNTIAYQALAPNNSRNVVTFVQWAMAQAARRAQYVWGANGPTTFDCSGLVQWCLAQVGISFPHYSGDQYSTIQRAGSTLSVTQAFSVLGALLFRGPGGDEHVAISLGDGHSIVNAEDPANGVRVESNATGFGFTLAGVIPGLIYPSAPAAPSGTSPDLII